MKRSITALFSGALTWLMFATCWAGEGITIRDAWVREAPPSANVLAGYVQIENISDATDAVIAVSSYAFQGVEIHRSTIKDGIASMSPVDELELPARQTVKLAPGGIHLMLIKPKSRLLAGQHVTFRFTLRSGNKVTVDAVVLSAKQSDDQQHH